MIFYYIRHGDPVYNPDSLTDLGHKQADALAKRLSLYGLDEIYCSTSMRAQMTADPTCKALKKEKILLDWTNEHYAWKYFASKKEDGEFAWSFVIGNYIEKFKSFEVRKLDNLWYQHPYFKEDNFADGVKIIDEQVDDFLLSLGYKHDRKNNRYQVINESNKKIALFAHQGMGLLLHRQR